MLISSSCANAGLLKFCAAAAKAAAAALLISAVSSPSPASASAQVLVPAWQRASSDSHFSAVRTDGTARFLLQLLPADAALATTRQAASALMQRLQGFELKPVLSQRGFSFSYTDVLPCKGLVSWLDGGYYLFTSACGLITAEEFENFYREGAVKLHLSRSVSKAHPGALPQSGRTQSGRT